MAADPGSHLSDSGDQRRGEVLQLRCELSLGEGEQPACGLCRRHVEPRGDLRAQRRVHLLEAAQRIERVETFTSIRPDMPREEPGQVASGVQQLLPRAQVLARAGRVRW